MFRTRKGLLAIILLALFWSGGWHITDMFALFEGKKQEPVLSERAKVHILHGDGRGGGHLHGTGKPCKSEFPADWNEDEIVETVSALAANDNLDWRRQSNGYYTSEETVDGVRVRVVLDRERDGIVTAYPVNVRRNPCPARMPANDNFND